MDIPDFDVLGEGISDLFKDDTLKKNLWMAGYFIADFERNISLVSKPLVDLGFKEADMMNGEYQRRIHQEDFPTYKSLWDRVFKGWEDELYCEYRLSDPKGQWHWVLTHAIIVNRDESGAVVKIIGTDRNISSQKYAEGYIYDELLSAGKRGIPGDSEDLYDKAMKHLNQIVEFDYCEIHIFEKGKFETKFIFPNVFKNNEFDFSFVYYDLNPYKTSNIRVKS